MQEIQEIMFILLAWHHRRRDSFMDCCQLDIHRIQLTLIICRRTTYRPVELLPNVTFLRESCVKFEYIKPRYIIDTRQLNMA